MPISDTKKLQTCVNLLAERVMDNIVGAQAAAAAIRQAIVDNDLAGALPEPTLAALVAFVTDLETLASRPVVATIQNQYVPTHRSQALIIEGVND